MLLLLLALNPNPFAKGVQIKTVAGKAAESGLEKGQLIYSINGKTITNLGDFQNIIDSFELKPVNVNIGTDKGDYNFQVTNTLGFEIDSNLTVLSSNVKVEKGSVLKSINNVPISNIEQFNEVLNKILPYSKINVKTNKGEFVFLSRGKPDLTAEKARKSNLKAGLDLEGGTRVLIQPKSDTEITDKDINDLISVLDNRLNVYGLSDLIIRAAKDWEGNKYILVEIAGVTKEEVKELIGKQGKFEAKIGDETVFIGGKKDITFVCRGDGSCSGIRPPCSQASQDSWYCKFEFAIHLSGEAAKKQADVTRNLEVNASSEGSNYLSKTLDLFLDDTLVDSLQISEDLKGREATAIAISGPGFGVNQQEAANNALKNMDKLQTILITGSLPLKIEVVKTDTISPTLGSEFVKSSFLAGLFALLAVAVIVFIRYRKFKIVIPMIVTIASELYMTLGIAALIQWNLDIASIAGIMAAVGTGIDDQIIMTDEVLKGSGDVRYFNWKQRIKGAFFIVFSACATMAVAMIPLWNAGAGLLRGFAVTTLIGIAIGVFLTRPAFAQLIEKLLE